MSKPTPTEPGSLPGEAQPRAGHDAEVGRAIQLYVGSIAVWLLYVPHHAVLWLLGPRYGMGWVWLAAHVHWLLTFVGAQRTARMNIKHLHPLMGGDESVAMILRRHLLMKHECFARVRVYNLHGRANGRNEVQWRVLDCCHSALSDVARGGRGRIIVGYHFGFYQMFATALSQLLPGLNAVQLRYRTAPTARRTASVIARLALRKVLEADRRSGAPILYIDDRAPLVRLFRLLRGGGCVTMTADGMFADDFIDVPFFDGMMRVPSGWARLAAATHSDIVILCDTHSDSGQRDAWGFNHVQCATSAEGDVRAAVAGVVKVLEEMISRDPASWHPWQRLRRAIGADGRPLYQLEQYLGVSSGGDSAAERKPQPAQPCRPRVAVLANSLTPYRTHLHERLVEEVPEVELHSLTTHGNAYGRWTKLRPPESIRPTHFGLDQPTNHQTRWRYSLREWRKGGRVIRWLRDHDVAAVFCQGCGDLGRMRVIRWCHRHGVPCFLTGDFNVQADRRRGWRKHLKRAVYSRAVAWTRGLMPCGEAGRALLNRYGGRHKPLWFFPFAPDVDLFRDPPAERVAEVRERLKLNPQRRRILFSARMMRDKRPDLALAAFAEIAGARPEWDLVMLGDGPLRAELESNMPSALQERVIWGGAMQDAEEVAAVNSLCDILLLPSDHEPWGVVVVEAAAAGLAIVASSAVGATPELVHTGENGAVFPAGDLAALVDRLLTTTDPGAIDALRARSREILEQWLATRDPVTGFRTALEHCGVIAPPPAAVAAGEPAPIEDCPHPARTAQPAVAAVALV